MLPQKDNISVRLSFMRLRSSSDCVEMAANPSVGEISLGIDSRAVMSTGPSVQRHEHPATPGGDLSDLGGISTGDLVEGALIAQHLTPGEIRDDAFEVARVTALLLATTHRGARVTRYA
jgi:hypothetical protein